MDYKLPSRRERARGLKDLLNGLFTVNPQRRWTAEQALCGDFLRPHARARDLEGLGCAPPSKAAQALNPDTGRASPHTPRVRLDGGTSASTASSDAETEDVEGG